MQHRGRKVQTIHDLIIQKVEYNHDLVNSDFATENTEYSQSVYSVLCTNKTVCAGYAQTFEMMCNGTGIDTVAVTSFEHEWNKIKLENSWYNVDCTWMITEAITLDIPIFCGMMIIMTHPAVILKNIMRRKVIGKDICLQQKWIVLAVHGYL